MNRLTKSAAGLMLAMSTLTIFSCDDEAPKVYGLNDAAQYGKITVTLEGTRPDGEDFTEKKVYRFLPEENVGYSSVQFDGNEYFYVQRQHGAVTNSHNDNYAAFNFEGDGDTPVSGFFYLYTSVIDDDDNVVFYLDENFSLEMEDVDSFSYDEETGKLKLKFTTELDGESNNTGNDLTITVDASVSVFEQLNGGGGE